MLEDIVQTFRRQLAREGIAPMIDANAPVAEQLTCLLDAAMKAISRCRMPEALYAREQRLETIIENLAEGVVISTTDGRLLHWNRAARIMHGFTPEDDLQQRLSDFTRIYELSTLDGTTVPFTDWPLQQIIRGETLHDWELRIRRLDFDWERIFSYGGVLVREENDASLAILTITDITARKRGEVERERLLHALEEQTDELQQLNDTLEQRVQNRTAALETANAELEAFSYSVSHDLRAPLRSIDGFSKILIEQYPDRLDERGKDYLARVRAAAQRMNRLIDDMLHLSRIGRAEMQYMAVDISALAATAVAELRQRYPERRVDVRIMPGMTACGDAGLLRIVIDNLLGNAWKFTGQQAEARIEVGMEEQDHEHVFFVRDNGAGFAMTYADKLFVPFQRLHGELEFPGTGIGLAIVKRIIARHGGRVWAEGREGEGATFYFTLAAC